MLVITGWWVDVQLPKLANSQGGTLAHLLPESTFPSFCSLTTSACMACTVCVCFIYQMIRCYEMCLWYFKRVSCKRLAQAWLAESILYIYLHFGTLNIFNIDLQKHIKTENQKNSIKCPFEMYPVEFSCEQTQLCWHYVFLTLTLCVWFCVLTKQLQNHYIQYLPPPTVNQ